MKFLKNIRKELKNVKWPDKKYMLKYTISTIAVVIFLALFFTLVIVLVSGLTAFVRELI